MQENNSGRVGMGSGNNFGNHILKPGKGMLYKPTWDNQCMVFRILPGFTPQDRSARPQFDPYRVSPGQGDYGQWFWPVVTISGLGINKDSKQTFAIAMGGHESWNKVADAPAVLLRKAIENAKKERREPTGAAGLLEGGVGAGAAIPKSGDAAIVHSLILQRAGKVNPVPIGFAKDRPMAYTLLSRSAFDAVVKCGDEPSQTPNAEAWQKRYLYQDPIAFDTGKFVVMYKEGNDPRQVQAQPAPGSGGWNQASAAASTAAAAPSQGFQKYECHFEQMWGAFDANIAALEEELRPRIQRFSDIIHVATEAEQVGFIVRGFPNDQHIVVFALDDQYGRLLPQEYRSVGLQRLGRGVPVTTTTPGAPPGGFYPANTPAPNSGTNGWPAAAPPQSAPTGWGAPAAQPPAQPPTEQPVASPAQPPAQPAPAGWGAPSGQPPVTQPPAQVPPVATAPGGWGAPPVQPVGGFPAAQVPPAAGWGAASTAASVPSGQPEHVTNPPELAGNVTAPPAAGVGTNYTIEQAQALLDQARRAQTRPPGT